MSDFHARSFFPGSQQSVYMDVAVRGLISTRVRDVATAYIEERTAGGRTKQELFDLVQGTRDQVAAFLNAHPDEIAFTKNVSEGLSAIAAAYPWKAGDNVVLCTELEHPNNVLPWYNLARQRNVHVRVVEADDGRIPVERMVGAINDRTRIVTVPTVTFSPGFVTPLERLSAACRERDVLLLADAAQSVGVLETDVQAMGVDALVFAAQKAVCSFYGQGFLYCRREWADRLRPAYLARFGIETEGHETSLAGPDFQYGRGARRFDLGNFNYLGVAAARAALGLLTELGAAQVERYVRGLAARLAAELRELGLDLPGGEPGPHLAHIVTVGRRAGGRGSGADDPLMDDLSRHLHEGGVRHSIRGGVVRLSLHLYNDDSDVDRVVELVREWVGERASTSRG